MDHAVGGGHVGLDDLGVVHRHVAVLNLDAQFLAVDGLGLHRLHVRRHDLAGHDVVGQNGHELLLVLRLEQVLERARRQLREGLIGGSEDREGPLALQRLDQAGRLDGGDEGLEVVGAGSDGNNVARGLGMIARSPGMIGSVNVGYDEARGQHGNGS